MTSSLSMVNLVAPNNRSKSSEKCRKPNGDQKKIVTNYMNPVVETVLPSSINILKLKPSVPEYFSFDSRIL